MSDDFHARYRLLKVTAVDGGIRTHNAQETTTGRVVLVHIVDAAGPGEVERLRHALGRLPAPDRARVLEMATIPAGFAVVTEFIPGMGTFRSWLSSRVGDWAPPAGAGAADGMAAAPAAVPFSEAPTPPSDLPAVPPPPVGFSSDAHIPVRTTPPAGAPPVPADDDDDPALLLGGEGTDRSTPPVAFQFSVGAPPPNAVPDATPRKAPGEFTRLFIAGGLASMETGNDAPPPAPPAPTPAPPSPPPPPATPPATREPGEFTRMFAQAPLAPPPAPPPADSAAPPAPQAPSLRPGEFTGLFQQQAAPRPPGGAAPSPLAPLPSPASFPP
ncbi:hypothetical protein PYV61_21920, partial [Roseisolibacter sp. H3M3-2]|nr:hypothetical protein [Roseisolibacter sp. H3M3-2]